MNCQDKIKEIKELEKTAAGLCYTQELTESEFCMSLTYKVWYSKVEYNKYCIR